MLAKLKNFQFRNLSAPQRRRIFVITIAVVILALIIYGFLPQPAPVEAVAAGRATLRVTVEEEGRTRVRDRYVVSAPVPGFLRRLTLEAGDTVNRGQAVASLEPLRSTVLDPRSRAEAEAAVAAAQAALDAARERARAATADAEYARDRADRTKQLFANGYVARDELDQAQADAKRTEAIRLSAEAAVIAAQADLERAESVLRYSGAGGAQGKNAKETVIVRSPVSGRVLKLVRESEGVVAAGEPLLEIGNPRNLEVRVEALSADAVRIAKDMPVLFERWGGERPLEGRVRVVEPSGFTKISSLGVEEQRVLVIVGIASPPELWERLGDGYRLDASFILWDGKDVLQVPASALFRRGEGWGLFTVENKRARLRDVEVGRRNGLAAQILNGVAEGELVIIHPEPEVKDGVRVKVTNIRGIITSTPSSE